MSSYKFKCYEADSGRGTGKEKVLSCLLTSPNEILNKTDNFVLDALDKAGLSSAIGTYFYRFKDCCSPFIKIGECTRKEGISLRFKRGWHGTEKYTDTYHRKKSKGKYTDSELLKEIRKISKENPAYFVFYQHITMQSHPKIDEAFAYRAHKRFYGEGTLSPERMNSNFLLARNLIWHKSSFSEVCCMRFPDGSKYG